MSLSTTSTATYVLLKYSRSYPPPSQLTGPSQQSQSQQPSGEDWQHFTNPVIKLTLDIKKRATGELDAYRLRIVWSLNGTAEPDAMDVDQRDVVFEDLELLTFSKMPAYHAQAQTAGLPLKAVYRDGIVGIRYQHPRVVPPGSVPTYRRIQVNFESADAANMFIESIQQVCPCKANLLPHSMRPPGGNAAYSLRSKGIPQIAQPPKTASTMLEKPRTSKFGAHILNPIEPSTSSLPPRPAETYTLVSQEPADDQLTAVRAVGDTPPAKTVTELNTSSRSSEQALSDHLPNTVSSSANLSFRASSPSVSGYPQSSQVAPKEQPIPASAAATASVASTPVTVPNGEALLSALREIPALYDLPRDELEYLVAQVIREDGFVRMVETLDSLWRIKGLWEIK